MSVLSEEDGIAHFDRLFKRIKFFATFETVFLICFAVAWKTGYPFSGFFALAVIGMAVPLIFFASALLSTFAVGYRREARFFTGFARVYAFLSPVLLFVLVVGFWMSAYQDNVAADAFKPMGQSLVSDGAHLVCGGGDPGHGPDNITPWDYIYYTIPASSFSQYDISKAASSAGFSGKFEDSGYEGSKGDLAMSVGWEPVSAHNTGDQYCSESGQAGTVKSQADTVLITVEVSGTDK